MPCFACKKTSQSYRVPFVWCLRRACACRYRLWRLRVLPPSKRLPYTTLFRSIARVVLVILITDFIAALLPCLLPLTTVVNSFRAVLRKILTTVVSRSEEHTSELQSLRHRVCRVLLVKKQANRTVCPSFGAFDAPALVDIVCGAFACCRRLNAFPTRRSSDLSPGLCS